MGFLILVHQHFSTTERFYCLEPPLAEPHEWWCERGELKLPLLDKELFISQFQSS
jgi:hypothetical protein